MLINLILLAQTLNLANERNAEEPQVLCFFGDAHYGDKIKMQLLLS
jgi:hypothetical protein